MIILSRSLEETKKLAESFLGKLPIQNQEATVVALSGNLGSGKTAFVQFVAQFLGAKENITSPTFVLIKSYQLQATPSSRAELTTGQASYKLLIHIDAYRLKNGGELSKLGWSEMVANPKNLIFIEWPENVADVIPKSAIKIYFEFINDKIRGITLG